MPQVKSISREELRHIAVKTDEILNRLESPASEMRADLQKLSEGYQKALKERDATARAIQLRILNATYESIQTQMKEVEQDLAATIWSLEERYESLGHELQELKEFSTEERSWIESAEQNKKQAEEMLAHAKNKTFFRERAVAKAEANLQEAQSELEQSQKKAAVSRRKRLTSASLEESLNKIQIQASKAVEIMQDRVGTLSTALTEVQTKLKTSLDQREDWSKKIDDLVRTLTEKEGELLLAEETLQPLERGTPEYEQQYSTLVNLKTQTEQMRGDLSSAQTQFQSAELFSIRLHDFEQTVMAQISNHKMWIAGLRSDTNYRDTAYRTLLISMKSHTDEKFSSDIDAMGAKTDQFAHEHMGGIRRVSDDLNIKSKEGYVTRLEAALSVSNAIDEHVQQMRARMLKTLEDMKNKGFDPKTFFSINKQADINEE